MSSSLVYETGIIVIGYGIVVCLISFVLQSKIVKSILNKPEDVKNRLIRINRTKRQMLKISFYALSFGAIAVLIGKDYLDDSLYILAFLAALIMYVLLYLLVTTALLRKLDNA